MQQQNTLNTPDGSGSFDNPNSIGNWDVSQLLKFIRDIQEQNPTLQLQQLQSEYVVVATELTLKDKIGVPVASVTFRYIGQTGQPAYANSYTSWTDATLESPFFVKDIFGIVRLGGHAKAPNPTTTNPAFTLPPGFRPAKSRVYAVPSQGGYGSCKVGSDGTVSFPSGTVANQWVSLDNIFFKAK